MTTQPPTPKLWLTTMCQAGNEQNLRELIDPIIAHFDGAVVILHDCPADDPGAQYVESVKKEGRVIHRQWVSRHQVSMNETLFCGAINNNDLVVWVDDVERINPDFAARIRGEIGDFMAANDIDVVYYYGKPFIFRYSEDKQYDGSPHWWLTNTRKILPLDKLYPNEDDVRKNLRPVKRHPRAWVKHYARYYIAYPAGSNTCLLGLEKNGDPQKLFPVAEARRLAFREELRVRGIPRTVKAVEEMLLSGPLDDTMKQFFREAKELNDLYRDVVLGDKTFPDDHDWSNMVAIP